ncbi:hypothetical protein J5N97_021229 [Dioscorea zingiberensis]|uniref:Lectin n=1 Tax=Dioscorea zingiberensis TaxID=325984 RepID=A0A9D5CJH9_9LILI|nr:hypothetical protein J5N97_021229 [Dioscorea zingiberensis]
MAHHLLPFIPTTLALVLFLSSTLAQNALFTEPLQILFAGKNITSGDLTLSLSHDCSLILYKTGSPVLDFNTSVSSSQCALFIDIDGQLLLVPETERLPVGTVGAVTHQGRYALLFINGKLGIFGPAMWTNGATWPYYSHHHEIRQSRLSSGYSDYLLFSGEKVSGNADGEVVLAENGKLSAVITSRCSLAVKFNGSVPVWHTWPESESPEKCQLELKSNGELVLEGLDVQWTGGFAGEENEYVCVLRFNGEILIYGLKTWLYNEEGLAQHQNIINVVIA